MDVTWKTSRKTAWKKGQAGWGGWLSLARRVKEARGNGRESSDERGIWYSAASGMHSRAHAASPLAWNARVLACTCKKVGKRARVRVQSRSTRAEETANEYRRPLANGATNPRVARAA